MGLRVRWLGWGFGFVAFYEQRQRHSCQRPTQDPPYLQNSKESLRLHFSVTSTRPKLKKNWRSSRTQEPSTCRASPNLSSLRAAPCRWTSPSLPGLGCGVPGPPHTLRLCMRRRVIVASYSNLWMYVTGNPAKPEF